jgi:hypothetical protein
VESPKVQLFNLTTDLAELENLEAKHPEVVARLTQKLESLVANGRSTPGATQSNAVPVDLWKKAGPRSAKGAKKKTGPARAASKSEK